MRPQREDRWDDLERLSQGPRAPAQSKWRVAGIWIFGIIGAALFGGLIGDRLTYNGGLMGGLAGMAIFACLRLWLTDRRHP